MGLFEWLMVAVAGCWLGCVEKPSLATLKVLCSAFVLMLVMAVCVDQVFVRMGSFGESPGSLIQRALFLDASALNVWFTAWAMALAIPLCSSRYLYSLYRHAGSAES